MLEGLLCGWRTVETIAAFETFKQKKTKELKLDASILRIYKKIKEGISDDPDQDNAAQGAN